MRRAAAVLVLGVAIALPARARASGLDIRIGGFQPHANSNLFDDDASLYTVRKRNWRGITGGAEFSSRIARNVEIGFNLDGYGKELDTHYRDIVRDDGSEIRQTLKLTIVPVGVTVRLVPTSRHARVAPFIGAGVDAFFWKYEEFGDFVAFPFSPGDPVIADSFRADGVATGFHVAGGLRLFVSDDFGLTGEVRYTAAKANMQDDFVGNRIDLGGFGATVGVHFRF
jgi:hypothetical protein